MSNVSADPNVHAHREACARITKLLTNNPTGDEIARALAIDFLLAFDVTKVRLSMIRNDDSLLFLGDFGFTPSTTHTFEPSAVWRKRDDEIRRVEIKGMFFGWNPEHTCAAALLKIRGTTTGTLALYFRNPLSDEKIAQLEDILAELVGPLSIFFFIRPNVNAIASGEQHDAGVEHENFTERQITILKQISRGSTNHEIASALGFSVSTIRHETMRIFQILGASDRHEAALKARQFGILESA